MHNFTFDDKMDHLFIHDYEIYSQFAPTEIRFLLEVQQLTFFMNDENDEASG